jgi:hypothetical protein
VTRLLPLLVAASLACAQRSALPVEAPADAAAPGPSGPDEDCAGFAEAEARRRESHTGPCPFCPCACTPGRGTFCAPCAQCVVQPIPPVGPPPEP